MKIKKMWSDGLPTNNPRETGRLNQNVVLTKELGSLINEDGFSHILDLPTGLIGGIEMTNNRVCVFFKNILNEIGIINLTLNTYTPLVRANFNFNSRIKGTYNKEFNDDDIIVFWDDDNQPRILNITNLPFELNPLTLELLDSTKLDLVNIFPSKKYVNYSLVDVSSGGSLLTGVYYFSLKYELPDGALTDAINISNPVTIIDESINSIASLVDGAEGGKQTDKLIKLSISNIDLKYKHFKLIVVHKISGITQAYELNTKYSTNSINIVYSGSESKSEVSLQSLLVKQPLIHKIEDATVLSDELLMGGITEKNKINLQEVANNITTKWVVEDSVNLPFNFNGTSVTTKSNGKNTFKDSITIFNKKGFQSYEVYALYITGIYKDGSKTEAFPIPGRDIISSELDNNLLNSEDELYINSNAKNFHFNDYAQSNGIMGYWQNENELYPEGFGTLTGKKVRHHRFPSLSNLSTWVNFYRSNTGTDSLTKILGLKIENVNIPENIKSELQGYEISYAKRTIINQTILGESLSLSIDWEKWDNLSEDYSKLRFHDFNLLKYKPSILPTHFSRQLELSKIESGTDVASVRTSYMTVFQVGNNITTALKNVKYIPNNNTADLDYNNEFREEFLYGEVVNTGSISTPTANNRNFFGYICVFKEDVYTNFYEQELVSTGYIHILDGTSNDVTIPKLYGGDTFKSLYYYRVIPPLENQSYAGVEFGVIVESPSNIDLRHEGVNWWETYYPKSSVDNPSNHDNQPYSDTHEIPNWLGYNNDYSSVNDLAYNFPYNPFDKTISQFPNRIMKSIKNNRETLDFNWRTFLVNDYYETRREFGNIKGLSSYDGKLLIHLEDALLITITTDRLKTSNLEVSLGSGGIFDREPDVIVDTKTGYAGLQSKFDYNNNLLGYCWLDRKSKSIFVFNGKLDKVSSKGLNNFFNDVITSDGTYNIFYEERFNRLFISTGEKTYSYYAEVEGWVAQHTFSPDFFFSIRNELYSTKDIAGVNRIYKHSVKGNKGLYYHTNSGRTINPSFITAVYNDGGEKILESIMWIADVYNENRVLQDNSFTKVVVYDTDKCSGNIELIPFNISRVLTEEYNIRKIRKYWTFNRFRDLVRDSSLPFIDGELNVINSNIDSSKPFYLRKRFMDSYFIIKLEFNNLIPTNEIVFDDIEFKITELGR